MRIEKKNENINVLMTYLLRRVKHYVVAGIQVLDLFSNLPTRLNLSNRGWTADSSSPANA